MNFDMTTLNQNMEIKQNYVTWIITALLFIWLDTSNYDENDKRLLPIGKNKKVITLFKDELGGKIMKEFCALRAKTYAYLMDDDSEKKKAKEQNSV